MSRVCSTVNRVRSQMKRTSPALALLREREASCETLAYKIQLPISSSQQAGLLARKEPSLAWPLLLCV